MEPCLEQRRKADDGYAENFETSLTEAEEEQENFGKANGTTLFRRRQTYAPPPTKKRLGPVQVQVNYQEGIRTGSNSSTTSWHHRRVFSTGDLPDGLLKTNALDEEEETIPITPAASDSFVQWLPASSSDTNNNNNNNCGEATATSAVFTLPAFPALEFNSSSNNSSSKDDDDSSMGSVAYFDPSDFDVSTWKRVLNDASKLGLVVVALATAMTHPLLFLAGAVTAFGTATAAHRGYDYCYTNNTNDDDDDHEGTTSSWRSWFCFDSSILWSSGNLEKMNKIASPKIQEMNQESQTTNQQKSDDATAECSSSGGTFEENTAVAVVATLPATLPKEQLQTSSQRDASKTTTLSKVDQQDWLLHYFPPLKNTVMECGGAFVGLNVVDFFKVFFDDDAPYNFQVFQEKRGDFDIHFGSWEPLATDGAISLFPSTSNAFADFPCNIAYRSFQGRTLTFKAKTNSFFGPPYATTTKTQRLLIVNKRLAILESKIVLVDIPYSERFFVMERWIITAEKLENRCNVAHVTASCEVSFNQSCPFEHQIKTKSTSMIAEVVTSWCTMATEAIKLTEKAKRNRLQRTLDDDDDDDDTDTDTDCLPEAMEEDADATAIQSPPSASPNKTCQQVRACSDDGVEVIAATDAGSLVQGTITTGSHRHAGESSYSSDEQQQEHVVREAPSPMPQLMVPSRRQQQQQTRRPFYGMKRRSFDDACTKASI